MHACPGCRREELLPRTSEALGAHKERISAAANAAEEAAAKAATSGKPKKRDREGEILVEDDAEAAPTRTLAASAFMSYIDAAVAQIDAAAPKVRAARQATEQSDDGLCHGCGKPQNVHETNEWLSCDQCGKWFDAACVDVVFEVARSADVWNCWLCCDAYAIETLRKHEGGSTF